MFKILSKEKYEILLARSELLDIVTQMNEDLIRIMDSYGIDATMEIFELLNFPETYEADNVVSIDDARKH